MTSELKFTVLDDTTHVIGFGEHTACGEPIPHGNGYTADQPKKLCPDCKARIKGTDEYGVLKDQVEAAAEPEIEDEPAPKAAKSGTKA